MHPQTPRTRAASRPGRIDSNSGAVANLRQVTTGELRQKSNTRLTDAIVSKLETLDAGNFVERQVIARVRILLELLRDTLTGHYTKLSVAAFAEILLAMDHFIEVYDLIPDTWPRGYEDDLQRIDEVWRDNRMEVEAYLERRAGVPGN